MIVNLLVVFGAWLAGGARGPGCGVRYRLDRCKMDEEVFECAGIFLASFGKHVSLRADGGLG